MTGSIHIEGIDRFTRAPLHGFVQVDQGRCFLMVLGADPAEVWPELGWGHWLTFGDLRRRITMKVWA